MDFGLVTFLIFVLAVGLILYRDRKRMKVEGFVFMRKTEKGVKWIEHIHSKYERFWKLYSDAVYFITPIAMLVGIFWLIRNSYKILIGATKIGAGLVLPSPTSHPIIGSGYVFLPLWLWIIGIMSIVIPHELSHGIVSISQKIKIKHVGYAFFLFIPAAFVEPDESSLKKAPSKKKIKIYGAGSFANFIIALLCLGVNVIVFHSAFVPSGVGYDTLINNSGAYNVSLNGTIIGLNGVEIRTIDDFVAVMKNVTPGEAVLVETTNGNYTVVTMNENGRPIIGIYNVKTYFDVKPPLKPLHSVFEFLLYVISWIGALNLGVGIVNMLPIKPLDGGLVMEEFLKNRVKNHKLISNIISTIFVLILIFNIIGPRIVS